MDDTLPFVAIGNEQLGEPLADEITCHHCKKQHKITCSSEDPRNAGNTVHLQFYTCDVTGKTYLAGIKNQTIDWKKSDVHNIS